jgi:hypothetical protein
MCWEVVSFRGYEKKRKKAGCLLRSSGTEFVTQGKNLPVLIRENMRITKIYSAGKMKTF